MAMLAVRTSGTWRTNARNYVKVGGTWRCARGYVRVSGTWRQYSACNLTVTAPDANGSTTSINACQTTSSSGSTVSVSGGSGSYTYSWAQGPGSAATYGPYTISSASSSGPIWTKSVCASAAQPSEQWTCTVTDTVTGATGSVTINVRLNHTQLT